LILMGDWCRHCKNENLGAIVEWKPRVRGPKNDSHLPREKICSPCWPEPANG